MRDLACLFAAKSYNSLSSGLNAGYKAKLAKSVGGDLAASIVQALDPIALIRLLYIESKIDNANKINSTIGNNSNNRDIAMANNKLDL